MAAKVTPYFILTAGGLTSTTPPGDDDTEYVTENLAKISRHGRAANGNSQSKKLISFTRNEITQKRMDLIRQRLEESRVRYMDACKTASNDASRVTRSQTKLTDRSEKAVPKIGDNITPHTYGMPESPETKLRSRIQQKKVEMVSLSNTKSSETSKGSFPYVYFVVSVDRTQNQSNSIQESVDESQSKDSRRYRSALMSRMQKRYIKEDDRAKMQQIAGEVGLKSDVVPPPSRSSISQRTISFPMSHQSTSPPRNPPATPATIGSACHFLDNDSLSMDMKGGKTSSIDLADISIIGTSRPSTKQMSTRVLELPFMSVDIQRKNLGTASASTIESKSMEIVSKSSFTSSQEFENRRVHFSETIDLPMIKGSRIVITPTIPTQITPRPSTMPALIGKKEAEFKETFKQAYERQRNFQHQTPGTPRPRRIGTPLTLPKIDIVSGVYDELVIKAIESYVREFPPTSKQGQVARQLLRQLQERSISAADLSQMDDHRMRGHKKLSIKELPDDGSKSRKAEYKTEKSGGGAIRRGQKSKDRLYSTIAPTCFKMANPGGLEETTSSSGSSKQNRKSAEKVQVKEQ
ncbi:uncharacterized protein LOC110449328 [Mizuhopecten yessoensis]|uniref:Uncharacterized protein n=1 Tax=Mizuhopecten yessoensis TaxID=6573 RepID=A0A210QRF7_MIZYE|nr:uncharacterized protein LOC110449328 [Mizuhopecten yessoensis]OWF51336.1 hypothetical protein KP79_PYT09673 [Mizuhopecten yessoensis]